MNDDTRHLKRFAETHDDAAFGEVVRRHLDLVYSAALRRLGGNRQLAEDATQQVFITLARKAAVVAKHPVLTGWLHTATRNEAINVLRAETQRTRHEQEAQLMSENDDAGVDWSRVQHLLDEAVDELSQKDRDAVMLRFFAKRSFAEISRDLGVTEDAARMRVQRALERLRVRLERRGVSSTAAALSLALTANSVSAAPASLEAAVAAAASAVAPATGPAVAFENLLEFMVSKTAIISAGALALAASGMVTWEATRAKAAEHDPSARVKNTQAAPLEARDAMPRAVTATVKDRALRNALDVAPREPQHAGPVTDQSLATTSQQSNTAGDAYPEVAQALREVRKAQAVYLYRDFIHSAQLTPRQIDDFVAWIDFGSSTTFDIDGRSVSFEAKAGATQQPAWMTGKLLAQFHRAQREAVPETVISKIAQHLQFTESPLRSDQIEKLTQAIIALPKLNPARPDLMELSTRSPGVLSEAQLGALERVNAQAELYDALDRARQERDDQARANVPGAEPGAAAARPAAVPLTMQNAELVQADPKLQVLALKAARSALTTKYGALYHRLGLATSEIERLETAMLRQQEQTMDLQALQKNASAETKQTLSEARNAAQSAYDDAVKGVLGPNGVQLLKDYERSRHLRSELLTLAGDCAASGVPLTPAQFHQLETIHIGASSAFKSGRQPELTNEEREAAQALSRDVLTPWQKTIADSYWATLSANRRLSLAVMRATHTEPQL